jgi:hypothetical protein
MRGRERLGPWIKGKKHRYELSVVERRRRAKVSLGGNMRLI